MVHALVVAHAAPQLAPARSSPPCPGGPGREGPPQRIGPLSATLGSSGLLLVTATDPGQSITLRQAQQRLSIDGLPCSFAVAAVKSIEVLTPSGHDSITITGSAVQGQQDLATPIFIKSPKQTNSYAGLTAQTTLRDPVVTGGFVLSWPIVQAWQSQHGAAGPLGAPTADEHAAAGGWLATLKHGAVYQSPAGSVFVIAGPAYLDWQATNGTGGPLGVPTGNAQALPGGATVQHFAHGAIYARGAAAYAL
jgi:hypothetical protein